MDDREFFELRLGAADIRFTTGKKRRVQGPDQKEMIFVVPFESHENLLFSNLRTGDTCFRSNHPQSEGPAALSRPRETSLGGRSKAVRQACHLRHLRG